MPVASLGSKLGGRLLQSPLWGSEGERGFGRFFAKICENIGSPFLEAIPEVILRPRYTGYTV